MSKKERQQYAEEHPELGIKAVEVFTGINLKQTMADLLGQKAENKFKGKK